MSETQYRMPSGWATGAVLFAGVLMMTVGIFQVFTGLAGIFENDFYAVTPNYFLEFDVTAWGVIHLLLGLLLLFAGWGLVSGQAWARVFAIGLAVLSAVANFLYIPYYPFWSLLVVGLNIWVLWALTSRWQEVRG